MNIRTFVIFGRVQGVGFRFFMKDVADRLRLVGEVWNNHDGTVEAIVQGNDTELDSFAVMLKRGPGRVDRVVEQPMSDQELPQGFRIRS